MAVAGQIRFHIAQRGSFTVTNCLRLFPARLAGLHVELAQGVDADHDQDVGDAVEQFRPAEGEAVDAGEWIAADGRNHQTDTALISAFTSEPSFSVAITLMPRMPSAK